MEIANIIDTRELNGDFSVINLKGKIINDIDIKEQKKMEKDRLKEEKNALKEKEKEKKLAAKEKEKAEKLAAKEKEKAEKIVAKENEKAEKIAVKEKEKAEKLSVKEKGKLEKQLKEKNVNKELEAKKKGRPRIEYNVKILANSQEIKSENEESNEEMYEYLEEEEYCIQIEVDGIKYYKDRNGIIYDFDTHVEI